MTAAASKRIDLHCHSDASNMTAEAVLNAIRCPESYSSPDEVYRQARRRGMDFVTLTDHDTIDGALRIADRSDVLVGEELSCWFPEDHCKMHVLVFGIDRTQHAALQARAGDIYAVAAFIEANQIAHSVAHPIYRQNDKLERWHLERLLLLFKGFECLNGAHSPLHREAFEPVLNRLSRHEIARLSEIHGIAPRWREPWIKARTGGSDDHGLLNVGRTWTEFPSDVNTPRDILACLREGRCAAGGEAGSSAKLAHTIYSVAVRYYSRHVMAPGATANFATTLLQMIVGETPGSGRSQVAGMAIKSKIKRLSRQIIRPFARRDENATQRPGVIKALFLRSARRRVNHHPALFAALGKGLPPLGEHSEIFELIREIDRDITQGTAEAIRQSIDRASFTGLFDSIAAVLAHQFALLPYYFAVFHQNKERHLLRQITGQRTQPDNKTLRVGLFTDTFDEINGVGRFLRDIAQEAQAKQRDLTIHTCCENPANPKPGNDSQRKNFAPLLSRPMPYYPELKLALPPILEVLEWADRRQFDAIHVSTPGPMGLCGWLVAKMLRVPMLATYHTDFPMYLDKLAGDHRVSSGTRRFMSWFYSQADAVFSRSAAYRFKLLDLGVPEARVGAIQPGVDRQKFSPRHRDPGIWTALHVRQPRKLLYVGRVSLEKNLPLLVDAYQRLCRKRDDVALIVVGDGPYLSTMKRELSGRAVYFTGCQSDEQLARLYAGSDLLIFPSRTDTLGQAVMEAQACGLPAIVSAEGGPKETVADGLSGIVLSSTEACDWTCAIDELLADEPQRLRMSQHAVQRAGKFDLAASFEQFWADHTLKRSVRGRLNQTRFAWK